MIRTGFPLIRPFTLMATPNEVMVSTALAAVIKPIGFEKFSTAASRPDRSRFTASGSHLNHGDGETTVPSAESC